MRAGWWTGRWMGHTNHMEPSDIPLIHDLAEVQRPGQIERVEEDDGSVRYRDLMLLAPGVWGDAGSRMRVFYSPEFIENNGDDWTDDTVNLLHDQDNEVTEVGRVDTDAIFVGEEDGGLYGDIVLHLDNDASRMADELMQQGLETDGRRGIQGPSVEIQGESYTFNADENAQEIVEGTFRGLGLVGIGLSQPPASKDAAFAKQTQQRAVALASDEAASVLTPETHETMDLDHVLEQLAEEHGIHLGDDPNEETARFLAETFDIELQEEPPDEDEEEDEEEDNPEDEDEDEEELSLSDINERVDGLAEQVEKHGEQIETIAAATETLRDEEFSLTDLAESVTSLSESMEEMDHGDRLEDLEARLQDIEEATEAATSLMDRGDEPPAVEIGDGPLHALGDHTPQQRL